MGEVFTFSLHILFLEIPVYVWDVKYGWFYVNMWPLLLMATGIYT